MEPIRILHVLHGLGSGGAESFIMNVYRNIDKSKVQFDFLIRRKDGNVLESEIRDLGGKIYLTADFPKNVIENYKELEEFFYKHGKEYKFVHVHANSLLYVKPLKIARKYGVPTILHSHNTHTAGHSLYKIIHNLNKRFLPGKATHYFACSKLAGNWMFKKDFQVIKNGIDSRKFVYNENSRIRIRNEFNLGNKIVIGNIARFTKQKNHMFLIDIFFDIYKKNNDAILMLVGEGDLMKDVKNKVESLGIKENVIFAGVRNDIPDLLSAMDIFLLPSLFEGLGIVLIEAQSTGVKCFTSDLVVPKDAKISNLVKFLSLSESAKQWANTILKEKMVYERENMADKVKCSGYDIEDVSSMLQKFYLQNK